MFTKVNCKEIKKHKVELMNTFFLILFLLMNLAVCFSYFKRVKMI